MPASFCECSENDCFGALIISHNQYPKTIIGRQKSLHIIQLLHSCNYSDFSLSLPPTCTCSFQLNFHWFTTACTRFTLHLHQLRTSGVACRFTPIRVNVGVNLIHRLIQFYPPHIFTFPIQRNCKKCVMARRRGSRRRPEPSPESQPKTVTAPLAETHFHDPKEPQSPERRRSCKRIAGVRKLPRIKKRLRSEKTRRSEAHESQDLEQSLRDQHMSALTFREGSNTRETESLHGADYMHDPSRIPRSTALDDSRVVRNVGNTDTAGDPRHSTDREMRAKSGLSYHRASPPASSHPPGTSHLPLQPDNRIVGSINIDEEPHRNQEIIRRRSEPSPLSSRDNITSERNSLPRKAVSRIPQKMSEASSVASRGQLNEPVVISRTRKSPDAEMIARRDPDHDRQMHMRAHPNQQNLPVSASRPPSNSNDGESASKEKSNEKLVLMGKLVSAQRKELDMEETISDQEKLIHQLRLEKSGLFLTITEKDKTISRLERKLTALNEAFDMQAHKFSRCSKTPGKGKIPDELQPYMSIVLAMEKELSTNAELETKELELARSDGVRIRCWLGRADTVQVGFGLLPGQRHSEEGIMPMCPIDLAERNGFDTPSGPSHEILMILRKKSLSDLIIVHYIVVRTERLVGQRFQGVLTCLESFEALLMIVLVTGNDS